jgi:hypothetical protein
MGVLSGAYLSSGMGAGVPFPPVSIENGAYV